MLPLLCRPSRIQLLLIYHPGYFVTYALLDVYPVCSDYAYVRILGVQLDCTAHKWDVHLLSTLEKVDSAYRAFVLDLSHCVGSYVKNPIF